MFENPMALVYFLGLITIVCLIISPRKITVAGFFEGASGMGAQPSLAMLVLSQVTTWIFARSLMNAALLGYFYGFAGTLAYTAYYLSFLTGMFIVKNLRDRGAGSVQDWLGQHFGQLGTLTYNIVIGLRLLSEVFANLIVIGLIFSAAFPDVVWMEAGSILAVAVIGLVYSMLGGLRASLRTDVLQMLVFLVVFSLAFVALLATPDFSFSAIVSAQGVHDQGARPGWVLVVVALLQVLSYPAHDPVMMDRGFIADKATTQKSFLYAFILSALCIFGFGMFGIYAGIIGAAYENQLLGTWSVMFGPVIYFLLAASLLVSALSTLDSALASSARLVIDELKLAPRTVLWGRITMLGFMAVGAMLTLWGNKTLFDAVAVSGTASMFLTPVFVMAFVFNRIIPLWSYLVAYGAAILGAAAYMYRGTAFVKLFFDGAHKYDQLLYICITVLLVGFVAAVLGLATQGKLARKV